MRDHTFSQRKKAINKQWGWRFGGGGGGIWTKFEKRVKAVKGGLHNIGGLRTLCQLLDVFSGVEKCLEWYITEMLSKTNQN